MDNKIKQGSKSPICSSSFLGAIKPKISAHDMHLSPVKNGKRQLSFAQHRSAD